MVEAGGADGASFSILAEQLVVGGLLTGEVRHVTGRMLVLEVASMLPQLVFAVLCVNEIVGWKTAFLEVLQSRLRTLRAHVGYHVLGAVVRF